MCGRYALYDELAQLEAQYEAQIAKDDKWQKSYNIAPTQNAPIIRNTETGRSVEMMRWGLVPVWAKDIKIGSKMINARVETIKTKPTYRSAFKNRCIVPANGFYEWKLVHGVKQPYFIHPPEGLFSFAGMWDTWRPENGEEIHSFTIVTTDHNFFMTDLHDRMPVILDRDSVDIWMDNKSEKEELYDLMTAFEGEMDAYPVSTGVNKPINNNEHCIERI